MVLVKISLQNIFGMMKYGWSNEWMGWRVKCKDVRVSRERYKGTKKSCMIEKYRRVEKRYLCWGGHGGCSWASPDDRGVPANLVLPEVLRRPKMTSWLNFMFFLSSLEILLGYLSHYINHYFFQNFKRKQKISTDLRTNRSKISFLSWPTSRTLQSHITVWRRRLIIIIHSVLHNI